MNRSRQQQPTDKRILEAAGDIFGRQGYRAATIRTIAREAGANVAAINYHFRGKEGLYRSVLEDIFSTVFNTIPVVMAGQSAEAPEHRLRFFIRGIFHRFLSSRGWAGLGGKGKLIAREFLDPTPAFETIVETYIRPHRNILVGLIGEIAGADPESEPVQACALSIIGQCIYYAFATPIIQRIAPALAPHEHALDRLADHVWRFSLGGILALHPGQDFTHKTPERPAGQEAVSPGTRPLDREPPDLPASDPPTGDPQSPGRRTTRRPPPSPGLDITEKHP